MKFTLVILTLNEIDGLKALYRKIPFKEFDEVFAVDGGSADGTLEFFKKKGIKILPQRSKGRGEAFRIAVEKAKGDVLIFFSPDGNENCEDLPKFKEYFLRKKYDLVIASRMMKGAHNEEDEQFFRWRKWANNCFNLLANVFFRKKGHYITDSINGFRAIKKEKFKQLKLDGGGYTIEYQMTIKAFKHKLNIFEFPTYEAPRIGGESYAKSIPTGIKFLKVLFKEIFKK
jgi:glycosyltransferase involved in cell wall biosynthesis